MKAHQLRPGDGISNLRIADLPPPVPAAHEVLIKTHAASLNYRGLMFARGDYINLKDTPLWWNRHRQASVERAVPEPIT